MEEQELLNMQIADIKSVSSAHASIASTTKVARVARQARNSEDPNFNIHHFWEIDGLCGCTLDVCATIEQAKQNAACHYYWEIWLVSLGKRTLINSINSKDEKDE